MALSRDLTAETILKGAKEASNAYQRLSGGYWIDYAPESFLQAWIALAFDNLKQADAPFNLMLEISPKRLYEEFDIRPDGRSVKMRQNQRFDILILDKNYSPRFPIEIKKAQKADACTKDAKRIREWIRDSKGTVKCGFIVAYTCKKGRDPEGVEAKAKIAALFEDIKTATKASHYEPILPQEMDKKGWVWDVACFTITS